jgi:hypothetical protein
MVARGRGQRGNGEEDEEEDEDEVTERRVRRVTKPCGDQSGRTSALAGVTEISDPSRADHVVCPTDFWFSL